MQFRAYKNLNKHCWSVKLGSSGTVAHHTTLVMYNVTFKVSEATRQATINKKQRSVHAWAIGDIYQGSVELLPSDREVSYNPFKAGHFFYRDNGMPIERANLVIFTKENKTFVR